MQPKLHSLIEQLCNVGSGFFISLAYWQLAVVPQIENVELTFWLNLNITLQYTLLSIARGYAFRRLFNRRVLAHV